MTVRIVNGKIKVSMKDNTKEKISEVSRAPSVLLPALLIAGANLSSPIHRQSSKIRLRKKVHKTPTPSQKADADHLDKMIDLLEA